VAIIIGLGGGWVEIWTGLRGKVVPSELRAVRVRAIGGGASIV